MCSWGLRTKKQRNTLTPAEHSLLDETWDMGHGTWDMGHGTWDMAFGFDESNAVKKPSFFFDITRSAREPEFAPLLEVFGCTRWLTRPLPTNQPGLVLDFEGVRLFSPETKPQYWHPGMAHLRLKRPQDPLISALGCAVGDSILDCTMGMGHDALVMSAAGCSITALETCAPILFFTNQGISHYRYELAQRIHMRRVDYREALAAYPDNHFDSVYLDPMFAKTTKSLRGFTWSMMRHIGLADARYTFSDIRHAYRVARSTVLLKLSPMEPLPEIPDLPQPQLVGSRKVKFAKWHIN